MIQVTFTLQTQRPNTPNTVMVLAPDTLLALKRLAEKLGCSINWDGRALFSTSAYVPLEIVCQLGNGGTFYDARVGITAEDATIPALAAQLQGAGLTTAPEKPAPTHPNPNDMGAQPWPGGKVEDLTGPPREPHTAPPVTPDPVLVPDPEDGTARMAAAWGE